MKKIGIALAGTGNIAVEHAQAVKKIRDAELCAVYSRSKERAKYFAARFKISAYSDYDRMLRDEKIDLVDIVTVNHLHADLGIRAARARKHLIIEKPIDISMEKAAALLDACKENGVKLTVISQFRFSGAITKIKKIVDDGRLGRLILGSVFLGWPRTQKYYDDSGGWRKRSDQAGGGVLMVQAIHLIDLLLWIMGPVNFVEGKVTTMTHSMETEDVALGILGFRSGAMGIVKTTTCVSSRLPSRIEIYGEKGSVAVEDNRIVNLYQGSNSYRDRFISLLRSRLISLFPWPPGTIEKQIRDMVQALRENKKPFVEGEEGRKALEIILGIYESSSQGRAVFLKGGRA